MLCFHDFFIAQYQLPYRLSEPSQRIILPPELNEISGLTDIDLKRIACVQDEQGKVFIFDLDSQSIVKSYAFDSIGDFEGLTYTKHSLFILRSDGYLYEWLNFNPDRGGKKIRRSNLNLPTIDNEGLCFDQKQNRLLIASKSKPKQKAKKDCRYIYSYNIKNQHLSQKPEYLIHLDTLTSILFSKQDSITEQKTKFNFRPSSLSIHPKTNDIYIISASDYLMVVLNYSDGSIKHIEHLDKSLFNKAEGITFLDSGMMIITNEAKDTVPTLILFDYLPNKTSSSIFDKSVE